MMEWILSSLLSSLWGWLSITSIIVIVAGLVFWFIPSQRWPALVTGLAAIFTGIIYAKGQRDRAALEKKRRDEAVRRNQAAYDAINKRPDTPADVDKRLNNGTF